MPIFRGKLKYTCLGQKKGEQISFRLDLDLKERNRSTWVNLTMLMVAFHGCGRAPSTAKISLRTWVPCPHQARWDHSNRDFTLSHIRPQIDQILGIWIGFPCVYSQVYYNKTENYEYLPLAAIHSLRFSGCMETPDHHDHGSHHS